jgi:hypothetical protein
VPEPAQRFLGTAFALRDTATPGDLIMEIITSASLKS